MKKKFTKAVDNLIGKALKMNVNSTTSIAMFQPKVPKESLVFQKSNNK